MSLLLVVINGCRCGEPGLGGANSDFRPQESSVDFGRVLEGTQARREVTLIATGRGAVSVTASTGSPFTVASSPVSVPGSGTAVVEVIFTAGNGPAEGTLVLTAGSREESVALQALGVRPLPCVPPPCHESRFDLETGTCIETPAQEGAACAPANRCEENGRCQSGTCVGSPRRCDDDNPCTVDACSPTQGCVTSRVACPQPSDPCLAGVCDREQGCVTVEVDDYTPCGSVDCKNAHVCLGGTCKTVTPPEGFVCALATACQDVGRCEGGECKRPDPTDLEPLFTQDLGGVPVAEDGGQVLLSQGEALFLSLCGGDAGCRFVSYTKNGLLRLEASWPDGGPRTLLTASDGGVVVLAASGLEAYARGGTGALLWEAPWTTLGVPPDAGLETWAPETGVGRVALTKEGDVLAYVAWRRVPDVGTGDGGPEDGGTEDGGDAEDGGPGGGDAGTPEPPPLEAARLIWIRGVHIEEGRPGGPADGGPVDAGPGDGGAGDAGPGDAGPRDAGSVDAGTPGELVRASPVEPWRGDARLALDWQGTPYLYTTDGRLARVDVEDGGASLRFEPLGDGGVPDGGASLAVAGGRLFAGTRGFLPLDGGAVVPVDWDAGTGTLTPFAEPVLMSTAGTPGYAFALSCAGPPCAPEEMRVMLRAVDADTGKVAWQVDVLPYTNAAGTLHEAALLSGGLVGVLADVEVSDGRQVWMELFAQGRRVGMCPLPGRPHLAGTAFIQDTLFVVVERDGAWLLESYPLEPGLEVEPYGWPQRHGASGERREAPAP